MKVTVISATEQPVDVISLAAGVCFGKFNVSPQRAETCYRSGHLSVFEHAHITFHVEGISRSCMAQLTRHRHASFCVESQRYNRYSLEGTDWYVEPECFSDWYVVPEDGEDWDKRFFDTVMAVNAHAYKNAIESGVKPEDARYLLPEATKTNLVVTMNVRELFHIFDMRLATSAQWEIRGLAEAMRDAAENVNDQWRWLMELAS